MKLSKEKSISIYYLIVLSVVVIQTIFSCVRLGQTVSYQHKLNYLEKKKISLQREKEEKISQLSQLNSLLANQMSLEDNYLPISSPIVISSRDTIALR